MAEVKYFPLAPSIQKEEYIGRMLEYGCYPKGPINRDGNIAQGYAFELRGNRFDFFVGLRNLSRSDFKT